jgi:putative transposase
MGLRFKDQELGDCFFVTTSFFERHSWGNIPGVYEALAEALTFRLQKTDSRLAAYVFMPSHLHFILFISGKQLSGFMRDFKKYTAHKSLCGLCHTLKTWQDRFDRQAIWTQDVLLAKIEYIHQNPYRRGLVDNPDNWKWSSSQDYSGEGQGPLLVWKEWY